MSESDVHRNIVSATVQAIQCRWPEMRMTMDIAQAPGDEIPPIINGHRPDIMGQHTGPKPCFLIAEVKTNNDIDKSHTRDQVNAFLQYLNDRSTGQGVFIFAVNGTVAHEARHFLQWVCHSYMSSHVGVMLFDSLDFWTLDPFGKVMWHLC